ncbi:MAG: hypothetical protein ACI4XW_08945 [Candidatus Spyradocola sp.]
MEMSSGILQAQEAVPVRRPVRGPHGGWQKSEIDALARRIDEAAKTGESLRSVFDQLGQELGRKPNSIRNFYYAQVRSQGGDSMGRALPFETFSQEEVEQLVRSVLTARAQGMSVRACVRKLADGDRTLMLRYQNKYRSTIRSRPELVSRVMAQLTEEGVAYVNPYAGSEALPEHPAMPVLQKQAELSGDPQLAQLFSSLDHLLALALAPRAPAQDSDAQRRADRLSAQLDVLRIELDNEQTRSEHLRTETEGMVTLLKEYIALPKDDRLSHAEQFCEQAAARLSAVECALMEP